MEKLSGKTNLNQFKMESIDRIWCSNDYSEAPYQLHLIATPLEALEAIKSIRDAWKAVVDLNSGIESFKMNDRLFDIPEDSDWRTDGGSIIVYCLGRNEPPNEVYVYLQSKWDNSDQAEYSLELNKLEKWAQEQPV